MARMIPEQEYRGGRQERLMPRHFILDASVGLYLQSPPERVMIRTPQFWACILGKIVEINRNLLDAQIIIKHADDAGTSDVKIEYDGFLRNHIGGELFECGYVHAGDDGLVSMAISTEESLVLA